MSSQPKKYETMCSTARCLNRAVGAVGLLPFCDKCLKAHEARVARMGKR